MKKNLKKLFLLALFVVSATSCLDSEEIDFGKGPIIVQFSNKKVTNNFLQDGTNAVYDYDVAIEYQGADGSPVGEDVTITIAVDPSSTATEGTEFSLSQTEFVIPAGSKTAFATIKVNSGELDALNPLKAVLAITSSSKTVSDKNLTEITLQAVCPSDLGGNYIYANGRKREITITSTGSGTYTVSGDNAFTGVYSFNFSDVCGAITITGGYLPDNFGIPVSGSGVIDETTGTITFSYTVDGYFDNRPMIAVKQ